MVYIGQTSKTLKKRLTEHGSGNRPISKAIREYGRKNFTIEEICKCYDIDLANDIERDMIKFYESRTYQNGYNVRRGNDWRYQPMTDEDFEMIMKLTMYEGETNNNETNNV